jgi:hypothetical protein
MVKSETRDPSCVSASRATGDSIARISSAEGKSATVTMSSSRGTTPCKRSGGEDEKRQQPLNLERQRRESVRVGELG